MKNFKTLLSLILALSLVFSCFNAVFAAEGDDENGAQGETETEIVTDFSDVDKNSTTGRAITELALRGVVTGYPDGTYLPEGSITRAEFAVICVRLANMANGLGTDAITGFKDLDSDDSYKWARPFVHMATGQGIITGFEDGTFRAGEPVTYEQAVKMLMCLLGYGEVCDAETKARQATNSALSWSIGYITVASNAGLLKNTNSNESVRTQPINRGDVAILAYNALNVNVLEKQIDTSTGQPIYVPKTTNGSGGGGGGGGGGLRDDAETVSGVVTGTYITSLDKDINDLARYEIEINGKKTYEIRSSVLEKHSLYDLIGQRVKMTYDDDLDIVTAISISTNEDDVRLIYSGVNGENAAYMGVNSSGQIEYCPNPQKDDETRRITLSGYNVLFNGKYIDGFDAKDLEDPDSPYFFKSGTIELVESGNYKTAKISSYDNYVVKGTNSSTNKISLFYKIGAERNMDFQREASSGQYFVFRRGTSDIKEITDLKQYDVMSVLESPKEAAGSKVKIIEVTRDSHTGLAVRSLGKYTEDTVELSDKNNNRKIYQYDYEYLNYDPEVGTDEKYDLSVGDEGVSIYLDYSGQIALVAMGSTSTSATAWKYGYLLTATQDMDYLDGKDYDLEIYLMDENGNRRELGAKSSIVIDGNKYNSRDNDILTALENGAEEANQSYLARNSVNSQLYQQPVRYKLSTAGQVAELDTVLENVKPTDEDLVCSVPYDGEKQYSSSGTFDGFSVGSATKIFYIPDERNSWDDYSKKVYTNFTGARSYHVEAYNIDSSNRNRAGLVLVYKTNDALSYNYRSSFMIVSDTHYEDEEKRTITGMVCSGSTVRTSTTTYNIDEDITDTVFDSIEAGDIVRFLTDSTTGDIVRLDPWFDVSDPDQAEPATDLDEAIKDRSLVYKSTTVGDPEPEDDITAGFRLAYGTVTNLEVDDKYITVSPTLSTDEINMETDDTVEGNSVFRHKYSTTGSSTTVFYYTGKREGAVSMKMEEAIDQGLINPYSQVDDSATRVVTYTTGNTRGEDRSGYLRFIYIVTQ